jgi:hypothetical protein
MEAKSLAVVKRVIHGMDFEFAGITRPRIHLSDGQASAEILPYRCFELLPDLNDTVRDILWNRFSHDTGAEYLSKYPYHKSFPE